ncbi:MAG: hypothetical protein JW791_03190 [Nanoarchaeota archaeon]|nr:hypothetical protein [Nanoarchaeota archaeon]
MVRVVKKDKKLEAFKSSKLLKSCKKAGMPEPIAKTVTSMISAKLKKKKTVTSKAITKMVFDVCNKMGKIPANWLKYNKAKKKKKK